MEIENSIFKKFKLIEESLEKYGFKKENNVYFYFKRILNDTFEVRVEIENEKVKGKIFDLKLDEEYVNYRIKEQTGSFVSNIRESFIELLLDIRNNCFIEMYFSSNQANRITNLIIEKFGNKPEFLWENDLGCGVFRNSDNQKWYAIIMHVLKSKLDFGNETVEIINVKLSPKMIEMLLKKEGFYQAYHMNKKKWLTIILDETVSDEKIIELITESYSYTVSSNEWIIPANVKYYDIVSVIKNTDIIYWHQDAKINIGDFVYIYLTKPYQVIFAKFEVLETDISGYEKLQMKLKLIKNYGLEKLNINFLKENGLLNVRSIRKIPKKLCDAIKSLV